ncbi:MAG: sugar phosphate isomerase/epimerase family protein [Candidatus Latescibacterota bacterium]
MPVHIATCPWDAPLEEVCQAAAQSGYEGIQYGVSADPAEAERLRAALDRYGLKLAATAAGGMFQDPATREAEVQAAVEEARRARALGAEALEMMCGLRPVGGPTPGQLRAYAEGLNEVGRRCRDLGVRVGVHNHCILFLETEAEIDRLYEHLDPKLVGTGFDTGHLALAGIDAAALFRRYAGRTAFVHLKDLYQVGKPARDSDRVLGFDETVALAEGSDIYTWLVIETLEGSRLVLGGGKLGHDYLRGHRGRIQGVRCRDVTEHQFAEVGHGGLVDFAGVFAALQAEGFGGWAAVELDVCYRTRLESASMSRRYLRERLGV